MKNVSKLHNGQVFKNYRELCEYLDVKVKAGKSKVLHLKEIERYCEIEKDGHKLKVNKVYEEVKEKVDGRKGNANGSIYGNIVQLLILNYLNKQKDKSVVISKTNLLQQVGLANRNYVALKNYPQKLANYIGYNILYVYDFYNINDTKLKQIVERALNSLQDKRLIFFENVIKVKHQLENNQRVATLREKVTILEIEKKYLKEYGYNKMSDIRISPKWKEFKKSVELEALSEIGIRYYYFAYDIAINKKYIEEERDNLEQSIIDTLFGECFDSIKIKSEVNNLILQNIKNSAIKRNNDVSRYFCKKEHRLSEEYIGSSNELCSVLIFKDASILINEVLSNTEPEVEYKKVDVSDMLPF